MLFEYIQDNIKITSQKDRKKISQETVMSEKISEKIIICMNFLSSCSSDISSL